MKLLLVKEPDALRDAIASGLRRCGFVVEEAPDAATGRWAARHLDVDVIVIDLRAPASDGLALLRELRDEVSSTPVLMLTAASDVEERLRAFEAGADDCLSEPV